jgi:predicted ribosome quality control (RQC) complex YloA/Tae2 family protein
MNQGGTMTLDGLTLFQTIRELKDTICGARIDKVFMPSRDEIDLLVRIKNENKRLKISAHPNTFRIHWTQYAQKNPDTPPVFCMFLRKHLINAIIEDICMEGLERIVTINIISRDEMGVQKPIRMIIELMGKHSNIILTDQQGKVMECLKHVSIDISRVRQILPSIIYTMPPGNKANPFILDEIQLENIISTQADKDISKQLCTFLQGLALPIAREMLTHIEVNDLMFTPKEIAKGLYDIYRKIINGDSNPHISRDDLTGKAFFSVLPFSIGAPICTFPSANQMLDEYFHEESVKESIESKRGALLKVLSKNIEKREKKLQNQRETLEEAKQAEKCKRYGDLITGNIYRLKKGADNLEAEDYFSNGDIVRISLDKRLTPSANAQKYYKRYNKLKSAAEITEVHMKENIQELDFLYSEQISLINSETPLELEEIRFELLKAGVIQEKKGMKVKLKEEISVPHAFISSDGFEFYAGKNNRQNDLLTLKYANANDIWMHIKDFPGAHVIIRTAGNNVPAKTLEEAAAVAAYLSRAKGADKIPIDFTQRKNVKKPGGAKPGMVIYENYRTIYIKPDQTIFERLKEKASELKA